MAGRSRFLGLVALSTLAAACSGATGSVDEPEPSDVGTQAVPEAEVHEKWFVELEEPALTSGGDPIVLAIEKQRFRAGAAQAGLPIVERFAFDRLWNGVSVHVSEADAAKLLTIPGVKAIYPVVPIVLDKTEEKIVFNPPAPVSNGPVTASSTNDPDLFTSVAMTGADVVQNTLGFKGDGIRVGVIDTGIDYDNPDLGGCFGPGCRVAFGYDFVGDTYDAATSGAWPVPDNDPDDNCAGHGTHVAGIIGANGDIANGGVIGVAPHVTFGAYRVFGCNGSTDTDIMLKAMERAEADGMRVINMSIGSSYQWPEYPSAKATEALVKAGIVVVASIGNSGVAAGLYAAGAPGVGNSVIGTASFDNTAVRQPSFTATPDNKAFGYSAASGAPAPPTSGTFTLTRTGNKTVANDACSGLAAGSLTGTVALIRRGTCSFYIKAKAAQDAGAAGVILYNNAAGFLTPTVAGTPPVTIPVVAITKADGELLDDRLAVDPTTAITWTNKLTSTPNPTAGIISTFSSYGLNAELTFKPDIGAPGGSIYSTYPLALGGHTTLSGTSMASPHVAGTAALLLQARPSIPAYLVRDVLQNTAVPANVSPTIAVLDAANRQGAGMVRIDQAIQAPVIVTPGRLSLGESAAGPATRTLTLTNTGSTAITYDLTGVTAAASKFNTASGAAWTVPLVTDAATISFSAPSVTVPANGTATVDVTVTADPALADASIYSGYVVLTPQGGGITLRVAYAGYKGDYQAQPVLTATTNGYPWLGKNGAKQSAGAAFTLQSPAETPQVVVHIDRPARKLKIEAFDSVKGKPYGTVLDVDYLGPSTANVGGVNVSTPTAKTTYTWDGTTTFNKQLYKVPNGSYVLKLSVLKPLGNESNPADWETWTSPAFTLNHP